MRIRSPPVDWKELKNYDLSQLYHDFKIAEFERKVSDYHVLRILAAITNNRFYDNVIRVALLPNKTWLVMDAQHRLKALYMAHKNYGLKKYDLMLAVYPLEYARLIYRRINMGRRLTTADHLKAMDDKKTAFFNELRTWLTHDPRSDKPFFMSMIQAISFSRTRKEPISLNELDDFIPSITKKEVEAAKIFLPACGRTSPTVTHSKIYRAALFRSIFRLAVERGLNQSQIMQLQRAALHDKTIADVLDRRDSKTFIAVYDVLKNSVGEILK